MFNQLFNCPRAVERHMTMPLVEQRLRYLTHRLEQGVTKQTLCYVAQTQLVVIEQLGLTAGGKITSTQLEAAADRWAALQLRQLKTKDCRRTRMRFLGTVNLTSGERA